MGFSTAHVQGVLKIEKPCDMACGQMEEALDPDKQPLITF